MDGGIGSFVQMTTAVNHQALHLYVPNKMAKLIKMEAFFFQLELTGKTGELDELLGGEHKTNIRVWYH